MIISYSNLDANNRESFINDCKKYCQEIKNKRVTNYFVDLMVICLKYEILPPDFLFSMAKAFLCLNGINNFTNNQISAKSLLQSQVASFLVQRVINDCHTIITSSIKIIPSFITNSITNNPIDAITQTILNTDFRNTLQHSYENLQEAFNLLR